MKKIILAFAFCLVPVATYAAPPANTPSEASVNELMQLTHVEGIIGSIYAQMDQMMAGMAQQMGIQASEEALFDQYMSKLNTLIRNEINWENMQAPLRKVYTDNFTQQEVNDMVAFYRTESGKAMVRKMPTVMQQSMLMAQEKMMGLMPQVREMAMAFQEEIQKSRGASAQ